MGEDSTGCSGGTHRAAKSCNKYEPLLYSCRGKRGYAIFCNRSRRVALYHISSIRFSKRSKPYKRECGSIPAVVVREEVMLGYNARGTRRMRVFVRKGKLCE